MFWVAWKGYNGGKALSLGTVEQAEAEAFGMHGYPTAAQAQAKPNSVNAVDKVQVNAWIVAANDITGNPAADAGHAAEAAGSATGLNAIGDLASALGQSGTWVRVAKVAIGAVLVVVGLARMTGTESGVATAATAAAKSVPGVGQAVRGAKAAGTAVKKKAGS